MAEQERTGSLLTPTQREFLQNRGEYYTGEYAKQQRYSRRESIRKRVWNGFLDGELLFNYTTPEQRRGIFDSWEEFSESIHDPADEDRPGHFGDAAESRGEFVEKARARDAFSSWVSFLYLGLSGSDVFDFESVLRAGIERAEASRGRAVTAFDFNVRTRDRRSLDELAELFDRRQPLTTEEIHRLRVEGETADEELGAYFDERPDAGGAE